MPEGKIIKALSGFYYVQSQDMIYECRARGKFRNIDFKPLVGDEVVFQIENTTAGYIMEVKERRNFLVRPPISNIDQAIIVVSAKEPDFSTLLLDKFLLLIESARIKPVICITKADLIDDDDPILMDIENYRKSGYEIHLLSAKEETGLEAIQDVFKGKESVITGQSGVGKSTLLNALNIHLNLETNEISKALGRGRHTTRHVELVKILGGLVADTPGFSSLELEMSKEEAAVAYHDFAQLSAQCKFRECLHDSEPHCKVKEAVETGEIARTRYQHYLQFLNEIKNRKEKY
ncbi:ribosome small subunit-dependent GTPase A [Beduini massiliensis]|uniref:ribosome small subunit-dependent GTPase A n=1 Tax=Beduini massiliensis TaxID=1585974 RepID=UPI00059A929F|nr:ribosome small subunit-dependent GTPase A [Beduini massiliensis]